MNKGIIYFIFTLIVCFALCTACLINKNVFRMEDAVETQLRYGTFKYPKVFIENIKYDFDIHNDRQSVYFRLKLKPLEVKDIDKYIDAVKAGIALNKYSFQEEFRKTEKLDDFDCKLVKFVYLKEKNSLTDDDFSEVEEMCYIPLKKNQYVEIKFSTFLQFYKKSSEVWKLFLKSYRRDMSKAYKTKFGSFELPEGTRDFSSFRFETPDTPHYYI